ncbi:MAG: hypothetical protein J6X39_01800 [Bacteroidales bacterium]|nr:hypothetical protein [Bacteroidales bacterium]
MKKTILTAVLCVLATLFAGAKENPETVRTDKFYVSVGGGTQISLNLRFIDAGGQLELGWWFSPYTAIALNTGGNIVIGRNTAGADEIFAGKDFDLQARILGLLELTNLFLGEEEGARTRFHIAGYAGLGKIVNEFPTAGTAYYWLPSIGVDLSDRISAHTSFFGRVGVNLYHPLRNPTVYPEASLGLRFGIGKGRTYDKDPHQAYKDNIAALEKELEKEKQKVKTDTVVVTETKEVEVEKIVHDTLVLKVNQVDTLTIYDVVEAGAGVKAPTDTVYIKADTVFVGESVSVKVDTVFVGDSVAVKVDTVFVKADTVYIKSLPEILVKTVYSDSLNTNAVDSVAVEPVVQVDTVYILSEPELVLKVQTDTVFVQTEPEVQIEVQKDTVFVPSEPEIMVRTVYVNKEPIVVKDTVFVATDPEVQIQTVYRDKEPVILVDTVYVQSEPEIEVRTVYRDREVVKVQKDTVFVELEPEVQVKVLKDTVYIPSEPEIQVQVEVQKDTVFVPSEPEIQVRVEVQKDTIFIPSEPEIMVRTVYVNKEPVIVKDTVFVATDPEVQIQTVYRDKEPVILVDTVYVQSEPEIEIRYRDREVVKVQKDTVFLKSEPEIQVKTDTLYVPAEPEIKIQIQKDTVFLSSDPEIQIQVKTDTVFVPTEVKTDTVFVAADPQIQIDTVFVASDPQIQVDTVFVASDPEIQIDTVVIEKDPVIQIDTVVVPVPIPMEPESTLIYVVFPENAAWVNYGARKQLDKIAKEIKAYDGDAKYVMIAPVSPDSEDSVTAYNLGVRRVSQVRLHLIRENGVDSRKLRESVVNSNAGIAVEDGNAFVIVAREDDPRIAEILGE